MAIYNLDSVQILTLTFILIPALAAIQVIFLQRELPERIIQFKKLLKEYRKKKAEELLRKVFADNKDVKESIEDSAKSEKTLEIVMKQFGEWEIKTKAISRLLNEEKKIYETGRYIIISLVAIFLLGVYSSSSPDSVFSGTTISRIDLTQFIFLIGIGLTFYWIWIIFNFGSLLNRAQSGELEDIEELIEDTVKKIIKEEG